MHDESERQGLGHPWHPGGPRRGGQHPRDAPAPREAIRHRAGLE